jgi:hypothetical protein
MHCVICSHRKSETQTEGLGSEKRTQEEGCHFAFEFLFCLRLCLRKIEGFKG